MTKWDSRAYHGQEPAHRGGGVRLSDALAQSTEVQCVHFPPSVIQRKDLAGTGPGLRPQTQLETEQGLFHFPSFPPFPI